MAIRFKLDETANKTRLKTVIFKINFLVNRKYKVLSKNKNYYNNNNCVPYYSSEWKHVKKCYILSPSLIQVLPVRALSPVCKTNNRRTSHTQEVTTLKDNTLAPQSKHTAFTCRTIKMLNEFKYTSSFRNKITLKRPKVCKQQLYFYTGWTCHYRFQDCILLRYIVKKS